MRSLLEAKALLEKVNNAIKAMGSYATVINESEVRFRHRGIISILIMSNNDISAMIKEWEK